MCQIRNYDSVRPKASETLRRSDYYGDSERRTETFDPRGFSQHRHCNRACQVLLFHVSFTTRHLPDSLLLHAAGAALYTYQFVVSYFQVSPQNYGEFGANIRMTGSEAVFWCIKSHRQYIQYTDLRTITFR